MKYVSFDTLIDLLDKVENLAKKDYLFFVAGVISGLKEYIKEGLPTVEIKIKEGKWIWKNRKRFCTNNCWRPATGCEDTWNEKEGSWIEKELYCSECNYENWRHIHYKYCPNCGCKMEK